MLIDLSVARNLDLFRLISPSDVKFFLDLYLAFYDPTDEEN